MAGVLSSCVLCSLHHLTRRFPRSPGALHSPPHIKASLISATLIFIHPMIIHLGLVVTCGTPAYWLSFTSVFATTLCMHKRMCSHAQSMPNVNAERWFIIDIKKWTQMALRMGVIPHHNKDDIEYCLSACNNCRLVLNCFHSVWYVLGNGFFGWIECDTGREKGS